MTVYRFRVGTASLIAVGLAKILVADVRAANVNIGRHDRVSLY
jgi:hypothetical protein